MFQLAEADTAILVSSKQQLQLDNQDLTESVKYLNLEVSKLRQNITEKDVNLTLLKRTSSTTEVRAILFFRLWQSVFIGGVAFCINRKLRRFYKHHFWHVGEKSSDTICSSL